MDQRIVEQARERARRAREDARNRSSQMLGDASSGSLLQTPGEQAREEAVRRAIQEASRRAAQSKYGGGDASGSQAGRSGQATRSGQAARSAQAGRSAQAARSAQAGRRGSQSSQGNQAGRRGSQSSQGNQEGGWGKGQSKVTKLTNRLTKKGKMTNGEMAEGEGSINSFRSYRAYINGQELTGTGAKGETKRYFHGEPAAAARKVVSQLHKGGQNTDIGQNIRIRLEEVTKGVRKADGGRYQYEYYGWREALAQPKTVNKAGQTITFNARNRVVPVRKAGSAQAARQASEAIGKKIQAKK